MRTLRPSVFFLLILTGLFAAEPPPGVPFETFRERFTEGDTIRLEQVWIRGSGPRVGAIIPIGEPDNAADHSPAAGPRIGDTVVVRGRYRLHTRSEAKIGLSLTTRAPGAPTPVSPKAWQRVDGGDGTFELEYVVRQEGELHVTFYPANGGSSFGGVYFRVRR